MGGVSDLSPERLEELLAGATPTPAEVLAMAAEIKRRRGIPGQYIAEAEDEPTFPRLAE